MVIRVAESRTVAVPLEAAYDGTIRVLLPDIFGHRHLAIPPIVRVEGQEGEWGTVGQTRTVVLADGSRNLETLVATDRPESYRYRLTDFTGPMKGLIRDVDGEFAFAQEGAGTRVTWYWRIRPTNSVARVLLPIVGLFWRRYADKMWPRYAARLGSR